MSYPDPRCRRGWGAPSVEATADREPAGPWVAAALPATAPACSGPARHSARWPPRADPPDGSAGWAPSDQSGAA